MFTQSPSDHRSMTTCENNMHSQNTSTGSHIINLCLMMVAAFCASLVTIGFMTVFNIATNGWIQLIPFLATAAGLIYIGRTGPNALNLREAPGAWFALSLGAGVILGGLALLARALG